MAPEPDSSADAPVPVVGTMPSQQQVSLEDLTRAAAPLVTGYLEGKEREQERGLQFETRVLEHDTQRFRYGVIAGSVLAALVLVLAGILIVRGDAPSARDLIALVVTAAGAWFGGYGMGRRRDRDASDDD